jgi:acyl-CoA hydrolase
MDETIFKKKTTVGWMLFFNARVNRVFGTSMELYVTVTGQSRDDPLDMIAAAFIDSHGQLLLSNDNALI